MCANVIWFDTRLYLDTWLADLMSIIHCGADEWWYRTSAVDFHTSVTVETHVYELAQCFEIDPFLRSVCLELSQTQSNSSSEPRSPNTSSQNVFCQETRQHRIEVRRTRERKVITDFLLLALESPPARRAPSSTSLVPPPQAKQPLVANARPPPRRARQPVPRRARPAKPKRPPLSPLTTTWTLTRSSSSS